MMTTTSLTDFPTELIAAIVRAVDDIEALANLSLVSRVFSNILSDKVFLKLLFYGETSKVKLNHLARLSTFLYGSYDHLKPMWQAQYPLHEVIQELKSFLKKIDDLGEAQAK